MREKRRLYRLVTPRQRKEESRKPSNKKMLLKDSKLILAPSLGSALLR